MMTKQSHIDCWKEIAAEDLKAIYSIRFSEQLTEGFLNTLSDNGVKPSRAILPGSNAKGTPQEWSDIDLAFRAVKIDGAPIPDYPKISRYTQPFVDIELHPFHSAEPSEENPILLNK